MSDKVKALYKLAVKDLTENLLPWWMEHSIDRENGGFYGAVFNDNRPEIGHSKFITLNARMVWTFASAYRVWKEPKYKEVADRAYRYLMDHFYDTEHGGFFSYVDAQGRPQDMSKYIYGNAFAIYGLSEYARAFGSEEAQGYARETRDKLEQYVYDPEYKGYFEGCKRDWTVDPWRRGMNRNPSDQKTMNTHLHLIEAYTCLLRVEDTPRQRSLVRQHLNVMLNKIVDHDIHHYYYFQDRQWNPTTPEVSYGHDIEGSWLMMEAAEVLGEPEAERAARDTCANMARACLEQGFREDGAMLSEYDPRTGHISQYVSWWEQNEAVVGFFNAWQTTGEERFLDAALKCFGYINDHFVDHEKGGWFSILSFDGKTARNPYKQNDGICPYHNGRMDMEIIERCRKLGLAD